MKEILYEDFLYEVFFFLLYGTVSSFSHAREIMSLKNHFRNFWNEEFLECIVYEIKLLKKSKQFYVANTYKEYFFIYCEYRKLDVRTYVLRSS